MKKYTISYLNKKYAVTVPKRCEPLHTPNTWFLKYDGHYVPFGNTAYCQKHPLTQPPKKQDVTLKCDDGNESSWGTLFFRELKNGNILFVHAYGRDCWGDWFTHWKKLGKELKIKEFEAIMREIALFYKARKL